MKTDTLPAVRGRYTENAPLGTMGWFRAGGNAELLYKPADLEDLQFFLQNVSPDVPVQTFGVMSNSIIRDGGVKGVVIRLGREFAEIEADGEVVTAGVGWQCCDGRCQSRYCRAGIL